MEVEPKDLKTKSFANVQELFDKEMKRVNTFVDMDTELVGDSEVRAESSETKEESSSKRTREELESDKSKKQKLDEKVEAEVDDAKEAEELKQCLEIVPDDGDDVTIDATPLSVKIPIVDYKIYQEGKKKDLEVLWRIVKARFIHAISAFVKSYLESIEQFLNNFANQPNETNMNNLESNDETGDTPLVSPFPYSDNDLDDGEVLNELTEYENAGTLRRERIINSLDGDDLAF
ncbi:hypothetical protein Tco_0227676 [Tanacetum coccineum]